MNFSSYAPYVGVVADAPMHSFWGFGAVLIVCVVFWFTAKALCPPDKW